MSRPDHSLLTDEALRHRINTLEKEVRDLSDKKRRLTLVEQNRKSAISRLESELAMRAPGSCKRTA